MGLPQLDSPVATCALDESKLAAHPDSTPTAHVSATIAPASNAPRVDVHEAPGLEHGLNTFKCLPVD